MENAVEALKIAFGVMLFVIALTLSISCFSQATLSVKAITELRDNQTHYTYVEPTQNGNRIVSVETIVPTMYKAYRENIKVIFLKENKNGTTTELPIYYKLNDKGLNDGTTINFIDLSEESFGNDGSKTALDVALEHLAAILEGDTTGKYKNEIYYIDGFYNFLKGKKFEERLGEYYQGKDASLIKKRVITYVLKN